MIRRERERGSRRDVYVVMDDAWHDVLMQRDQIYAPILTALVEARGAGGGTGGGADAAVGGVPRVRHREMGGIAERWEGYKAAPRRDRRHPSPHPVGNSVGDSAGLGEPRGPPSLTWP